MITTTEKQREEARLFYKEAILILKESGIPFMLGGAFALTFYTGVHRDTKDLDVFCRPKDFHKILKLFASHGFQTQLTDIRWLAKIFKGDYFVDIIFSSVNNICTVEDSWFTHAQQGHYADEEVLFLSAEDLIWCKLYVQNRERYDAADVNHILLRTRGKLDWERLLERLDRHEHWHLLLAQLVIFQFVYPSDFQDVVPEWLFKKLLKRMESQYKLPPTVVKVCRGPIIDQTQYSIDIKEWNYKSLTIMTT